MSEQTVMPEQAQSAEQEIRGLIERSRAAQAQIENYTQEQVDTLIRAMVWATSRPGVAEEIARFTVEETEHLRRNASRLPPRLSATNSASLNSAACIASPVIIVTG